MTWTAPPTFVSGNVLTAAQLGILAADLLETAAAKATGAGQWFVATGTNTLAARNVASNNVTGGDQGTTSLSFVDLTTIGPTVTVTTGTTVIVVLSAQLFNDTLNGYAECGVNINNLGVSSGLTLRTLTSFANARQSASHVSYRSGLTAGSNTFKMQYRAQNTGQANFNSRELTVLPVN